MIERLDNKNITVAEKILTVFQVSYAIEAKLLRAIDFPPLKRSLNDFLNSETEFYGFWKAEQIAAIIETKSDGYATHIQSLVVDPKFFRQGLARKLITFVFESNQSRIFTVETGVDNKPACKLYKKLEFKEVKQWDTDHGVRKIRFEKVLKN
jgi:ribosomal protein S18 acetylase RimI-like enzyme